MSTYAPYNDARTLILAANLVPKANIQWSNEPFREPNPPALWLSVDSYSPSIDMLDIGAKVYREDGIIRILCLAPVGTGSDGIRQLAKSVCDVFRGLGSRNPYYLNASISDLTSDNGLWFGLVVSVDFSYESASN